MVMNKTNSIVISAKLKRLLLEVPDEETASGLGVRRKPSACFANSPVPNHFFNRMLTPEIPYLRETPVIIQNLPEKKLSFVQILRKNQSQKTFSVSKNFELIGKKAPHFSMSSPFSAKNLKASPSSDLKNLKPLNKKLPAPFKPSIVKKFWARKQYVDKVYCKSDRNKRVILKKCEDNVETHCEVLKERKISISIAGWGADGE